MEKTTVWAYLTSLFTVLFGGITLEQVALWVGIITAVGTFVINWYYKERADDRESRNGPK